LRIIIIIDKMGNILKKETLIHYIDTHIQKTGMCQLYLQIDRVQVERFDSLFSLPEYDKYRVLQVTQNYNETVAPGVLFVHYESYLFTECDDGVSDHVNYDKDISDTKILSITIVPNKLPYDESNSIFLSASKDDKQKNQV